MGADAPPDPRLAEFIERLGRVKLTTAALAYLKARGISARAAAKRRLRVVDGKEAEAIFGMRRIFLLFPYFAADGKPLLNFHAPFVRGRLLGGAPTKHKFRQPPGTRNHPYYDPARRDWRQVFADTTKVLILTEGEVKAMAATEHGLACVAFGGVSSSKTRINGRSVPLPELDDIAWTGRPVEVAFDSDSATNPDVMGAAHAVALELTKRGGRVVQVFIPVAADGTKVGLDDFLAKHGAAGYAKLVRLPLALVLHPAAPLDAARAFLGASYMETEGRTLHFWRGAFYHWTGARYEELNPQAIRADVCAFLDGALQSMKDGVAVPYKPNKHRIEDVLYTLRAAATLDVADAPVWLDGRAAPAATELLAAPNGLLHLPTRTLLPHTAQHFNLRGIEFEFDAKAPLPKRWLDFLKDLWGGDAESIAALQEWSGYLLTSDARQQKILLLVGPPRSGKSTIAAVLEALVGRDSVAHPKIDNLGERFGLAPLIGKSVAILGDARLGNRADQQALAGQLLGISGQDGVTVDRKHIDPWTGRLAIRFLILSNEMPRIADASGALASRFIVLRLTKSFLGREDRDLLDALKAELPAILNWGLDGLDRLRRRGHFVQPRSAQEEVQLLADLSSPVKAFLRDECELRPGVEVPCAEVFDRWQKFCRQNGREHSGTAQSFSRDLHAAIPGLGVQQRRIPERGRVRCFVGVKLRERPVDGI